MMSDIKVLDKGYVRVKTYTPWNMVGLREAIEAGDLDAARKLLLENDLSVVNAARASFAKEKTELADVDKRLITFLADAEPVPHSSPARHSHVTLEVYAPLFVCRQWWRHIIGAPTNEIAEGTNFSEASRRYIRGSLDYYVPTPREWRAAPANAKQGSSGQWEPQDDELTRDGLSHDIKVLMDDAVIAYTTMVEKGVAPEQARMILPQNIYTSFVWTPSILALAGFLKQRLDSHAQLEIQEYAKAVLTLTEPLFPYSINAFMKG